jgi:CRP-like cAMP-binding protein
VAEPRGILADHPLFAGAMGEDIAFLAARCRLLAPRRGARLFRAGEPAEAFFLVVAGAVKLSRTTPSGREHVVELLGPGDTFALLPVLEPGGNYPVDATVLEPSALLAIPGDAYRALLVRRPALHRNAAREMGEKLKRFAGRLEEASTGTVAARIAGDLLRRAAAGTAPGTPPVPGTVVDLGTTREVVAGHLGTVREVLTRSLRDLERRGLLHVRGRRIALLDPAGLRALAARTPAGGVSPYGTRPRLSNFRNG